MDILKLRTQTSPRVKKIDISETQPFQPQFELKNHIYAGAYQPITSGLGLPKPPNRLKRL